MLRQSWRQWCKYRDHEGQIGTHLCEALIAATLAFFSATRFWMRALRVRLGEHTGEYLNWDVLEFCFLLLLAVESATVEGVEATAALQTDGSDKSLNFGSGKCG